MISIRQKFAQRLFLSLGFGLLLALGSCALNRLQDGADESGSIRRLTILYTNDEHGWMEGAQGLGGAAEMKSLWEQDEGYYEEGPFLILSGGDNWTGPAISTIFQGESMVEVMNTMGYSAAAIGNHEFDFKVSGLKDRIAQAHFPYLSANIREKSTGKLPGFARPYIIREVNRIKVGIIGLTTTSTPVTTFPDNVADYDFISYETALNEFVPEVRSNGAELLVVIAHICHSEMTRLAPVAGRLGISVLGEGHCNELIAETHDEVALVQGDGHLRHYAKVEIFFDTKRDKIVSLVPSTHENQSSEHDPALSAVISKWRAKIDADFSQVIGFASRTIEDRSPAIFNMVTDSWLFSFPKADVALTNRGGIRQGIPSGEITTATILGVLPFENLLVELDLTGAQLLADIDGLVVGGMTTLDGPRLSDGRPIHPDSIYSVLTTDFLYSLPTMNFKSQDATPLQLFMNYRQPLIDWLKSRNTSRENPLNKYLDNKSRK